MQFIELSVISSTARLVTKFINAACIIQVTPIDSETCTVELTHKVNMEGADVKSFDVCQKAESVITELRLNHMGKREKEREENRT